MFHNDVLVSLSPQSTLDDATDDWGIKVERVEIKDVKLPLQLQRAMAAEAEASREARAKVKCCCLPVIVIKLGDPVRPHKVPTHQPFCPLD